MDRLVQAELALTGLLVLGYIGINLVAELPRFLIGENLALAASYLVVAWLVARGSCAGQPLMLLLASFNAGRVSRSIVTPRGETGELALQHIPLLALILAVALIALSSLLRACR